MQNNWIRTVHAKCTVKFDENIRNSSTAGGQKIAFYVCAQYNVKLEKLNNEFL